MMTYIKFNNTDVTMPLSRCVLYRDRVEIFGEGIKEFAEEYIASIPEDFQIFIIKEKPKMENTESEEVVDSEIEEITEDITEVTDETSDSEITETTEDSTEETDEELIEEESDDEITEEVSEETTSEDTEATEEPKEETEEVEETKKPEEPVFEEPEIETLEYPGFRILRDDDTVLKDCENFIYKWNIYTDYEDGIVLTSSKTDRERKPVENADEPVEVVDPLNNDDLTECVADLMYELSCNELGLS